MSLMTSGIVSKVTRKAVKGFSMAKISIEALPPMCVQMLILS